MGERGGKEEGITEHLTCGLRGLLRTPHIRTPEPRSTPSLATQRHVEARLPQAHGQLSDLIPSGDSQDPERESALPRAPQQVSGRAGIKIKFLV